MRRSRIPIVIVMIIALVVAGIARDWAGNLRRSSAEGQILSETSGASLANMNSFALALLLGGLRGPLVMVLWTSSESQKTEKNLEDFDTKVEWIRLLQPEFDTVHIFQVWNKAYNISVQMASLYNKYLTILDALDYAHRVEAQRPNDINMLYAIAGIYFDKLGNSAEKVYYRKRVREETLPHPTRQKIARNDPGWRRTELDPVLDAGGNILPELLVTKYDRPADLPADSEWNTGAELQYLAPYAPLPDGVSTFGLGYNYYKRSQVIQNVLKQQHAQLSTLVVDSRPALALKSWAEDEWELARRLEMKAFNTAIPEERRDMEMPTAKLAVDAPFSDRTTIEQAIFSYNLGARLNRDALGEYHRHLKNFAMNLTTYQSHMEEVQANASMMEGDRDFLKAALVSGKERIDLLASAGTHYHDCIHRNQFIIFSFYIDDELAAKAFPPNIRRTNIQEMPAAEYDKVMERIQVLGKQREYDPGADDRGEFERYIDRAAARLRHITG
jgi:hypothetical protein